MPELVVEQQGWETGQADLFGENEAGSEGLVVFLSEGGIFARATERQLIIVAARMMHQGLFLLF